MGLALIVNVHVLTVVSAQATKAPPAPTAQQQQQEQQQQQQQQQQHRNNNLYREHSGACTEQQSASLQPETPRRQVPGEQQEIPAPRDQSAQAVAEGQRRQPLPKRASKGAAHDYHWPGPHPTQQLVHQWSQAHFDESGQ